MFESLNLKSVSSDQALFFMVAGAVLLLVVGVRLGYLVLPARSKGSLLPVPARLEGPQTTPQLIDRHKAAQAALDKQIVQLETELESAKQARQGVPKG